MEQSRPDTAGSRLSEAFAEPRVLGVAALSLADGVPTTPCQEGSPGSFPFLAGQKPQQRVLGGKKR